jgi:hAT family C-terminal dimerisation region
LFNIWHICLFNSKWSSASSIVSDTRVDLKDFIHVKKISEPIKSEIDDYLADALDDASLDDDFDILAWWKLKASKYHVLARLTRDILAVPISTVASESTFSTSGRTLNPVRNSLNNESIEALICGQDWLRASVTGMCCLLYVI